MSCVGPFTAEFLAKNRAYSAAEYLKADIANGGAGMPMIAYELHLHTAKLSVEP